MSHMMKYIYTIISWIYVNLFILKLLIIKVFTN